MKFFSRPATPEPKRRFTNRLTWRQIIWRHPPANPAVVRPKFFPTAVFLRILLGAFVSVLVIFGAIYLFRQLKIAHIDCTSQYGTCPPEINTFLASLLDKPLAGADFSPYQSELTSKFPVKHSTFSTRFPRTLVVQLQLRIPVGNIISDISGSQAALIDDTGTVVAAGENVLFASLVVPTWNPTQKTVDPAYVTALQALSQIKTISGEKVVGTVDGMQLDSRISNGPQVVVDLSRPLDSWHSPLQLILERSRISSKQPEKIDLRFNNPVLVYR